jgi:formylglycine-generating enzyme required for sulfatase activity
MEGLTPAYRINGSTDPDEWGEVPSASNEAWNDVELVAGSTGWRLPTEAQWEYAARAGTTTAFNTGDALSNGWHSGNSESRTREVGLLPPNGWGLHDMHGNVFEWVWDWLGDYPSAAETDPLGAPSGTHRMLRGGSWFHSAGLARSAYRLGNFPTVRANNIGVRLARPQF